jgi:hypothetical protein
VGGLSGSSSISALGSNLQGGCVVGVSQSQRDRGSALLILSHLNRQTFLLA